jgi:hypothetical protein
VEFDINFRYLDGKDFSIILRESDMPDFIRCLSSGEVFFNNDSKTGLWVPLEKIRYFTMKERVNGREDSKCITKISKGDGKNKGKKGSS